MLAFAAPSERLLIALPSCSKSHLSGPATASGRSIPGTVQRFDANEPPISTLSLCLPSVKPQTSRRPLADLPQTSKTGQLVASQASCSRLPGPRAAGRLRHAKRCELKVLYIKFGVSDRPVFSPAGPVLVAVSKQEGIPKMNLSNRIARICLDCHHPLPINSVWAEFTRVLSFVSYRGTVVKRLESQADEA